LVLFIYLRAAASPGMLLLRSSSKQYLW